jgi:hypothetical protein
MRALARRLPEPAAEALSRASGRAARTLGALRATAPLGEREAAERLSHVRALAEQVSLFLAPSRTLRERFLGFGIPGERIALHPYGHDPAPFAALRRVPSERLRIGFLGTLMISKAPHLVLEAFAGLPPGAASLELYGRYSAYHGDDAYRGVLRPLLALPGVRWVEGVDHAAVPQIFAGLDVLVVPSLWIENAPIVIAEAFLAGIPVVCSDQGGMAELVEHGVAGLRFRPGDAQDLRRQLLRLIEEPGLRERLRRGIPPVRRLDDDARVLRAHFARLAAGRSPRPARARPPRLAAVVVHHETPERTLACARAILASRRAVDQLVIVDNGSRDGSASTLARALPEAALIHCERNLGFGGGANTGLRHALADGAERVLLVNSDARLAPECVERLEQALDAGPQVGIAAPALLDASDPERLESLGLAFSARSGRFRERGRGERADRSAKPGVVDAVSGCVMLVSREVLEQVGLFDEGYFFAFEDVDLCLRARRAGFRCAVAPEARAWHEGQATIGRGSPVRLYYAARNHLRVARTAAPEAGWLHAGARAGFIVALNVAHALRGGEVARLAGVRAALHGSWDFLRGRRGAAPGAAEDSR